MPDPTEQVEAVKEARELLDAIDKSARVGYAFKLLKILTDEVEQLRELVVHMHVHSGYRDNGYLQMTTPQKALYDAVWERSVKELDEEENEPA